MVRKDLWDVLFWIAMLFLIGYIVAKLIGWINTPELVDLIPMITIVFIMGVFYQKVISFMDVMYKRTDYLKDGLDNLKEKIKGRDRKK